MPIPQNTGNWDRTFDRILDEIWDDNLKKTPQMYTQFFNVQSMTKAQEKHLTTVGLEDWRVSNEAGTPAYTSGLQGFVKNYTPSVYKSAFAFTRELKDDDLYDVAASKAAQMSKTAIRVIDKQAAKLLINATNTTYFAGIDGLALASSAHTREDGGTANLSNANTGVLNEANIETMLVRYQERLNGRGELIDLSPSTLLVPPQLEKEALILMKSTGRVGTSDNDINVYNGRLSVAVWKRLGAAAGGSDTAYLVLDNAFNKSGQGLNILMRVEPEIKSEVEIETGVTKFVGYMRFAEGFDDWRGVEHSTGVA